MTETEELCRVLIVDDEILIRQGIRHCVNWEREGFRIAGEASNGREALELIDTVRPHIVLTDLVMPVMDGEELTRAIKAKHPGIEVVVLSSFGEFEYVRSTFQSGVADYMLKPRLEPGELLGVLRAAADKIPAIRGQGVPEAAPLPVPQLIDRLVNGYELELDEEAVRSCFPHDRFVLLGVKWKHLHAGDAGVGDRLLRQIGQELKAVPEAVCHAAAVKPGLLVAVINLAEEGLAEAAAAADAAAGAVRASLPGTAAALGRPFRELKELGRSFRDELERLLQIAYYFPHERLIVHERLPSPPPRPGIFNLNRFAEDMKRGQYEAAIADLMAHVAALGASYTSDVFEYKSFLSNMVFTVTVLLGNMGYDTSGLEQSKYACFNAIDSSSSAAEAAERLQAFVGEAMACIGESASTPGSSAASLKPILAYIERHYAEPLTLKEIAKRFHFNASYLSTCFSAHAREGFTDYLNRIRIGKAADLLRGDTATISEISGKVGYSDHSYFCKVFKKLTGVSPSHYRRRHGHA